MAQLTGTNLLFSDNFSTAGPLNHNKWDFNRAYYSDTIGNPAFLGKITLMRQELPKAENGMARIQLDTWNADWKDGKTFYGSEAISKKAWDARSTGGVAFEAKMKFEGTQGGMIAGMFFYEKFGFPPSVSDPRVPHNELDWEVLTSQLRPSSVNKISTNVFTHEAQGNDEKDYPHSYPVTQIRGFSPNDWHVYRVEWLPRKVIWRIDGKAIRVETTHLPQASVKQQLHLNLWGVPTGWGPSPGDEPPISPQVGPNVGDPTFVPATSAGQNKTHFFDVKAVKVEQLSTRLGSSATDHLVGGASNDGIDGGGGNDRLEGGDGHDTIWGDGGDDNITGGTGNDDLSGGKGDDDLSGDAGSDTEHGGAGADVLHGGIGLDALGGGGDNDQLYGEDGNDHLSGGRGDDVENGGDGDDDIHGRDGDDDLSGGQGDDDLSGEAGNDTENGGLGNDKVNGNDGNDRLYGGDGSDDLRGGGGNDRLKGGAGADHLNGGKGNDVLIGGDGADTFAFSTGGGSDKIVDYQDDVDKIDLSSMGFTSADNVLSDAHQEGPDVVIDFGGGDVLKLVNVNVHTLDAGDFII